LKQQKIDFVIPPFFDVNVSNETAAWQKPLISLSSSILLLINYV